MLDRSMIRENLDSVQERLRDKGFELDRDAFLKLDQEDSPMAFLAHDPEFV